MRRTTRYLGAALVTTLLFLQTPATPAQSATAGAEGAARVIVKYRADSSLMKNQALGVTGVRPAAAAF